MKTQWMTKLVLTLTILSIASVTPKSVRAQENGLNGPPKVLVVHREMMKPHRGGMMHEKTEGAFVAALRANHVDIHYFAMTSMSGPDRALFFSGYGSMAAWETDEMAIAKHAMAAEAMDHANAADGDLLAETSPSVWLRDDEMSRNPHDLKGARYMQISQYLVKPGHVAEWEELVKVVKEAYAKGVPEASWVIFEERYGANGNAYIVLTSMKSLSEVDGMLGSGKAFADALGEGGMKKLGQLEAACVESWQMNLFSINPKMSNPSEQWVKDDPDFWAPKKTSMPMKKADAKPM
jgi:hypothetical protein